MATTCMAQCLYAKADYVCNAILPVSQLGTHVLEEHDLINSAVDDKTAKDPISSCSRALLECPYKKESCWTRPLKYEELQIHLKLTVAYHLKIMTAAYKRPKSVERGHSNSPYLPMEIPSSLPTSSAGTPMHIIVGNVSRYYGGWVWEICNIRELCMLARMFAKDSLPPFIFSPSFYYKPGGYKGCLSFCIRLYQGRNWNLNPNSIPELEEDKNHCVALYFHFMKGENDNKLKWPFDGEININMGNPRFRDYGITRRSASQVSDLFSTKKDALSKPVNERNCGIGDGKFCDMATIFDLGFVKNKCLKWEVGLLEQEMNGESIASSICFKF